VTQAAEVVDKLDDFASDFADPAAPALPTSPEDVERILTDAAKRRITAAATRSIAAELRPAGVARLNAEVRTAGAAWVGSLCKEFGNLIGTLRTAAPTAPRCGADEVSQLGPAQFQLWSAVTNTVLALEEIVSDRGVLAQLLGEPRPSHWGSIVPLIAAVAPPSGTNSEVHKGFQERVEIRHTSEVADVTTRWYGWLALEQRGWLKLALAGPGEIAQRIVLVNSWPAAFESLSIRDGGASFQSAVAGGERTWQTMSMS